MTSELTCDHHLALKRAPQGENLYKELNLVRWCKRGYTLRHSQACDWTLWSDQVVGRGHKASAWQERSSVFPCSSQGLTTASVCVFTESTSHRGSSESDPNSLCSLVHSASRAGIVCASVCIRQRQEHRQHPLVHVCNGGAQLNYEGRYDRGFNCNYWGSS